MTGRPAAATTAGSRDAVGPARPPHHLPRALTLPMMLGSGALISLQSDLNGALAHQLGTGARASALAALVSFGSGLVVLTAYALLRRSVGRGIVELLTAVRRRRLPLWSVLGGLAGAFFVASQGLAAPALGITFFVLCFVAGQAVMALAVDHRGWGPNPPAALSPARVLGAVLALLAVAVSGAGLAAVTVAAAVLLLAVLPLAAGALNSLQQGVNGRLAVRVGPWVTTWNNFFVGTLGLVGFGAVTLALPGHLVRLPTEPWLYLGGMCGVGFIWANTLTVREHGVLVVGVFSVAGQVLTAAALGALAAHTPPPATTWLAVAVSLLGAVVVGLGSRRAARRAAALSPGAVPRG